MKRPSIIVVVFDGISRGEFFRRLEWPFLVKAWSKAISWEQLTPMKISLKLAGIDGLDSITVTRRRRGDKVFIGARNSAGALLQSGIWEFETETGLGVCYRRVYKPDLVNLLCERLADFCWSTFLTGDPVGGAPQGCAVSSVGQDA